MLGLKPKLRSDGDAGVGGGRVAEGDGVFGKGGILLDGGQGEGAIWAEFEAQVVGDAAHGPAGVDFAHLMPL